MSIMEVLNLKNIMLQSHKGVESECPENTMASFKCAVMQGYDVIELDLWYTKDGKIVVIHDKTINRTARNADGSEILEKINIDEITYDEAKKYDFGIYFSNKFRGEKLPLFTEVLLLAKESNIRLKIDNKIENFSKEMLLEFFNEIKSYEHLISITSKNIDFIKQCLTYFKDISIDYDGEITEEILVQLREILSYDKLTVWLPYKSEKTAWVRTQFVNESISKLVKKYARLGIWIISNDSGFAFVRDKYKADIVETMGEIKPEKNINLRVDMHTHSRSSHDSETLVSDMAESAYANSLLGFAVTDHCDIEYCDSINLDKIIKSSLNDAKSSTKIKTLKGIEIGEGSWHTEVSNKIISNNNFDVIIALFMQ